MRTKDYGFRWVPGDRGDDYILNESSYTCIFDSNNTTSLHPDDVWLDVGAHFGSFAIRAASKVKQVIAAEPAPLNVYQLRQNIALNDVTNIVVLQAAITGGGWREVNLALGRTFDYTHRIGHIRGRENLAVLAINVNDTVERFGVNKIKMDCEGSEEEILEALDYAPIQEIILEWHFTLLPDPTWEKLRATLAGMRAAGFEILRAPVDLERPTKRWTAIIWARRP